MQIVDGSSISQTCEASGSLREVPLIVSHHASQRAQRRGVSSNSVLLAATFGKRERARDGKTQRRLGRKEVERIRKLSLVPPSVLDRLRGITVVTLESGDERIVITVLGKCT